MKPVDCEREIVELHRHFEGWFRGELPDDAPAFARFERALAADFALVTPSGRTEQRAALLARLREAHGVRADAEPPFRIQIARVAVTPEGAERQLATYEEWQRSAGEWRGRVSTALLRVDPNAPLGLAWARVHETWLPAGTPMPET